MVNVRTAWNRYHSTVVILARVWLSMGKAPFPSRGVKALGHCFLRAREHTKESDADHSKDVQGAGRAGRPVPEP